MIYLSSDLYDAKYRASWGVGLSACSLGQLDMVWWMILVCSSLHAIDRGTSLVCKDKGLESESTT